jgi:two-component system, OmpR family, sensor histidine kinase BaeS
MAESRHSGSLRGRLVLAFVAVAMAAVAALAVVIVLTTRSETARLSTSDRARTTSEAARVLADAYSRAGSWANADLTAAQVVAQDADAVLVVRSADGRGVIAGRDVAAGGSGNGAGGSGNGTGGRGNGTGGRGNGVGGRGNGVGGRGNGVGPIVVSHAVEVGGRQVGIAELRFRGSLTRAQSVLRDRLFGAVLLGSAVAVAIALLGAALVTRAIAIPLRRLAAAARRLQAGDLAARAGAQGAPGELGQLSRAFDGMADTLDSEREARRRLVSDLAHEVRTPIAILQGNLEELVDEIAQATPQRLASLHEEVLRLGALVEDLDALAHADAPVAVIDREPVDLEALARAQVEALRPRLDAKALTLEQQFSPVTVLGDRARLGQVLANLLSNAIKFTPEGGQIKVLVDTAGGDARISVADSGPGIPADEQGRVLERFWRGNAARGTSGRGIGLAIAADIIRAHGGQIEVGKADAGGARFVVTLPAASGRSATQPTGPQPAIQTPRTASNP